MPRPHKKGKAHVECLFGRPPRLIGASWPVDRDRKINAHLTSALIALQRDRATAGLDRYLLFMLSQSHRGIFMVTTSAAARTSADRRIRAHGPRHQLTGARMSLSALTLTRPNVWGDSPHQPLRGVSPRRRIHRRGETGPALVSGSWTAAVARGQSAAHAGRRYPACWLPALGFAAADGTRDVPTSTQSTTAVT